MAQKSIPSNHGLFGRDMRQVHLAAEASADSSTPNGLPVPILKESEEDGAGILAMLNEHMPPDLQCSVSQDQFYGLERFRSDVDSNVSWRGEPARMYLG
jgi:hypothetical protein